MNVKMTLSKIERQLSEFGINEITTKLEINQSQSWTKTGVIIGGWTLFALFFACQRYIERAFLGEPTSWTRVLSAWTACSYLWAALTPPVLWLAKRFPFERKRWLRPLLVHTIAGALISVFHLGIYLLTLQSILGDSTHTFASLESLQRIIIAEIHFNVLIYAVLIGISHAVDYYRQKRERELSAAQLETKLALAELDALRLQLQPHFLFNTLNTISVLMIKDVKAANKMLRRLSELLRIILKNTRTSHEITLREELDFLSNYLEIEQTRFSDRLKVKMNIAPETLDAQVPSLILQPIVENAIRHGIAPHSEAGRIEICAERINGMVRLQVSDDGAGLQNNRQIDSGSQIGLANTKSRLLQLYGETHNFELTDALGGGTVVTISIPFNSKISESL